MKWLKKLFKRYHQCPNNGCKHNKSNHYCELNGNCHYENKITGKKITK